MGLNAIPHNTFGDQARAGARSNEAGRVGQTTMDKTATKVRKPQQFAHRSLRLRPICRSR